MNIGHNSGFADYGDPLLESGQLPKDIPEALKRQYKGMHHRLEELIKGAKRMPSTVEDEKTAEKFVDQAKQFKSLNDEAEHHRITEKAPALRVGEEVDKYFNDIKAQIKIVAEPALETLGVYLQEKIRIEREKRAEEARIKREKAEAALRKLDEAQNAIDQELALKQADEAEKAAEKAEKDASEESINQATKTRSDWNGQSVQNTKLVININMESMTPYSTQKLIKYANDETVKKMARAWAKDNKKEIQNDKSPLPGVEFTYETTTTIR